MLLRFDANFCVESLNVVFLEEPLVPFPHILGSTSLFSSGI
jgi:hypothetical protein